MFRIHNMYVSLVRFLCIFKKKNRMIYLARKRNACFIKIITHVNALNLLQGKANQYFKLPLLYIGGKQIVLLIETFVTRSFLLLSIKRYFILSSLTSILFSWDASALSFEHLRIKYDYHIQSSQYSPRIFSEKVI